MNFSKKSKGFTLLELLVVIAIIAVLSTIIYASFGGAQAENRDKKRVGDISLIKLSLEAYFNANGQYPTSTLSVLTPTYIAAIPTPPSGGSSGQNYGYNYYPLTRNSSNLNICTTYQLWTTLETKSLYLASKVGLDSLSLDNMPVGMQVCNVSNRDHDEQPINASSSPFVYDVMPQ